VAARTLLLKLERKGYIKLPPRQRYAPKKRHVPDAPVVAEPIRTALRDLRPLCVSIVAPGSEDAHLGSSPSELGDAMKTFLWQINGYLRRNLHKQEWLCYLL
jgi:hypothetical protein